jgi:hypothetical protein
MTEYKTLATETFDTDSFWQLEVIEGDDYFISLDPQYGKKGTNIHYDDKEKVIEFLDEMSDIAEELKEEI